MQDLLPAEYFSSLHIILNIFGPCPNNGWSLYILYAVLINTSRGGIINELDLYNAMSSGLLGSAAIDVFDNEPYNGKLIEIERCLLTAHMGSMSLDCRARMELEATEETIRFMNNKPLKGKVPAQEYELQKYG